MRPTSLLSCENGKTRLWLVPLQWAGKIILTALVKSLIDRFFD